MKTSCWHKLFSVLLTPTFWLVFRAPDTRAATTINVTSTADSGVGSLRAAITTVNSAGSASFPYTITLPAGTYKLTSGELAIGPSGLLGKLLIIGTGTSATTIITNSDGASRVFVVDPNTTGNVKVAFSGLTITGGNDTFADSYGLQGFGGGGILTGDVGAGGDFLTLTNCVFVNNRAGGSTTSSAGGAVSCEGGGMVAVGCVFTNNTFAGNGSSIWLGAAVYFIAEDAGDTLNLNGCTFQINAIPATSTHLAQGGAVAVDSGNTFPAAYITNCVFGGNTINSSLAGGADYGGGALYLAPGTKSIISGCAFTNNQANGTVNKGGAILCSEFTTNVIVFSRFVGNTIASGGSGSQIYLNSAGNNQGPFNANDNWWASESGPSGGIAGTNTANAKTPVNWLFLTNTASSATDLSGAADTLTASFLKDSAGNIISALNLAAMTNLSVAFGATDGSISGAQSVIQTSGAATATFTGTIAGAGNGSATVDGVTASAAITVQAGVSSVTSTPSSTYYKAGGLVAITVNFSSAVTVTGTPQLTLTNGTSAAATYASGSGNAALVFNYTVAAGDTIPHLDYASASALTLNGGTIIAGGGAASLTLPAPGAAGSLGANTTIVIDTTAPTVAIGAPSVSLTNSNGSVTYAVTWLDTNLKTNSISLTAIQVFQNIIKTGTAGFNSITVTPGAGSSANVWTVKISNLTGSGTLSFIVPAGTAKDLATNSAPASSASAIVTVDNTPPAVTISPPSVPYVGSGGTVSYTVTWSDANLDSSSISLSAAQVSNNISKTGTVTANSISVSAISGNSCTVLLSDLTGDGTVGFTVPANTARDLAGNQAAASSPSATTTVENTPPTVTITSQPPAYSPTNTAAFSYTESDNGNPVASQNYQLDGGALTTATSPVDLSGLDAGSHTFTLQVTDQVGNIGTASYTWLVGAAPAISVPPSGQTVAYGSNATFNVTVTGTPILAYQWYFDGDAISGATATNYDLTSITTNNAGDYTVIITNFYGSITSSVATLAFSVANPASNLASSENPAGFLDGISFTATLPTDATGNLVFASTNGPFSTNDLSGGIATSSLINTLPRGTNLITAIYSGDFNYAGSTLTLNQVVTNHPPLAGNQTNHYPGGTALLINIASLLTNNVTDADGDTITLTAVGVSTNGISPATNATFILYLNTNNVNDQFVYTVSDGYGGSATGTITMVVDLTTNIFGQTNPDLIASNGAALLTFYGIPGEHYSVWRSTTDVSGPYALVWTTNAPAGGRFIFTDDPAPTPSAFYKLSYP